MKYYSHMKLPSQTSKKLNQSKKTGKDDNKAKRTNLLRNSECHGLLTVLGNRFHSVIQIWRPSKPQYQKTGFPTAECLTLCNSIEDVKQSKASEFLQACRINKRNRAFVLFDIDNVSFLRETACLHRTRAELAQVNASRHQASGSSTSALQG